ncbi:MAG: Adaptive-response sensory-kinase SasA [Planctomycetes bacterium]|nr:Adaptive-response sensory-kinase SasA [Planctomycetota bacterium]
MERFAAAPRSFCAVTPDPSPAATPNAGTHPPALDPRADALIELVAAWPAPALVATRTGSVRAMNDAARALLDAGEVAADVALHLFAGTSDAAALVSVGAAPVERIIGDDGAGAGRPAVRARAASLGSDLVLVTFEDASHELRLRSHLGLAERLASIGELLSSVAHELNNPLTTVLGYADLLLSEDDAPGLPRAELEKIREEAMRCRRIVTNLLDLARSEQPDMRPVSMKEVAAKVVEFRSYAARIHGIDLAAECDEDPRVVNGDFHRLVQAILNLVTNAEDAVRGRDGPRRIRIRVRNTECGVAVDVEDSGPGVPDAVAPHVFHPFFTTKPRGKGTGLGLSLVRGTARQHGGDARVSRAPGGGAVFTIELPAVT